MRAVVVGGSGQIGSWLLKTLTERGHEAIGTYATVPYPELVRLDASDAAASSAWIKEQRPDVVFYPAGFTWVDGCEQDAARNRSANVEQPLRFARSAAEVGAWFVHFSTDYVFDGSAGPYSEDATPAPLNAYGRAKLEAEHALLAELKESVLIARTCWVFGPERQGKNFAYQVVKALREGRSLTCPSDQTSTPSYGPDVALECVMLAEARHAGIIHLAGPDVVDRPTFARMIAQAFGQDSDLIAAKPTAELGQGAPRPLRGGLSTVRIRALGLPPMRTIDSALQDFRANLTGGLDWANPLDS